MSSSLNWRFYDSDSQEPCCIKSNPCKDHADKDTKTYVCKDCGNPKKRTRACECCAYRATLTPLQKLTQEYTDLNVKYNVMNTDWEIKYKKLETENLELIKLILTLNKIIGEQKKKIDPSDEPHWDGV